MGFYKENKVNPFGSCIPLLVQAPIFIALYFVLRDLDQEVKPGDDLSFISASFVPDITAVAARAAHVVAGVMMIIYVGSQMALDAADADVARQDAALHLPGAAAWSSRSSSSTRRSPPAC